ncbi:unnamed protein product [Sphagnum balticum]
MRSRLYARSSLEIGDVGNWAQTIEDDIQVISEALEAAYKGACKSPIEGDIGGAPPPGQAAISPADQALQSQLPPFITDMIPLQAISPTPRRTAVRVCLHDLIS